VPAGIQSDPSPRVSRRPAHPTVKDLDRKAAGADLRSLGYGQSLYVSTDGYMGVRVDFEKRWRTRSECR